MPSNLPLSTSQPASPRREFTIGGTKVTLVPATEDRELLATLHIADFPNPENRTYKGCYTDIYQEKAGDVYKRQVGLVIRARLNGRCLMSRSPTPDIVTLSHEQMFPQPSEDREGVAPALPRDQIQQLREAAFPELEKEMARLERELPDISAIRSAYDNIDAMVFRMLTSQMHQETSFAEQAGYNRVARAMIEEGNRSAAEKAAQRISPNLPGR